MNQEMRSNTVHVKNRKKGKKLLIVMMFGILVGALAIVSFAYYKEKTQQITIDDVQSLQQQEADMTLKEISQHIYIPEGVKPTVATITNVDNLRKEMPFFNKAENGFKVIVFEEKAVLFDPINKIIVDVAPIRYQQSKKAVNKIQDDVKKEDKEDVEKEVVDEQEQNDNVDELEENIEEDSDITEDTEESTDKE